MEFILNNWKIIASAAVLCIVFVGFTWNFLKKPRNEQTSDVKKWLLVAVDKAEKEFGSGTGKLKLARVYSLFVSVFPEIAKLVSLETFADWVDDALKVVESRLRGSENDSGLEE